MRSTALLAAVLPLIVACVGPRVPEWREDAVEALDAFRHDYLAGRSAMAARHFAAAKEAISATGKLELAARAELVRCALATASLDFDACAEAAALVADAGAEDRAYAAFLIGDWNSLDAGALPAQYRGVAGSAGMQAQNRAMQAIEDPLSRLVAAGVLFRRARLSPEGVRVAVDTASDEGYRRPLLAWLNVQASLAEAAGDTALLESIRKRIELVSRTGDLLK